MTATRTTAATRLRPRILEGMSAGVGGRWVWRLADPVERCFRLPLLPRSAGLVGPGAARRAGWTCQREPYCGANGWRGAGDVGRLFGWCDWRCRRRRVPRSSPALPSRVRSRRRRDWPADVRERCGSGSWRRFERSRWAARWGCGMRERKRDTMPDTRRMRNGGCRVALWLRLCCTAPGPLGACEVVGGLARQVVGVITASGHWSACLTPPLLCAQ